MEFFGIGAGELLLLLVLALIVVGPQKLPEIGRNLGRAIQAFKTQTDLLRSVMTFDPPASPPDARVTALQDYLRPPAPPAASEEPAAPPPPPAARAEQESAS